MIGHSFQGTYRPWFTLILLLPISLFSFQNCSAVNFGNSPSSHAASSPGSNGAAGSPASSATGVTGIGQDPNCTSSVQNITALTKIMFLIDTSGSNSYTSQVPLSNGTTVSVPPTDPQKSFRKGAIQNFLQQYQAKTNFQYSIATFAQPEDSALDTSCTDPLGGAPISGPGNGPIETCTHSLINSGNDQSPVFTSAVSEVQTALNQFAGMTDDGDTPYYAAFDTAIKAIQSDPDLKAASTPNYVVILLTDGMPTDHYNSNDINQLTSVAPGRITVSTIYYSTQNVTFALQLLQAIANAGNGVFASATNGGTITIDDVIPKTIENCQ